MSGGMERVLAWLDQRAGVIVLDGPVAFQDGSAWLRIAPGEQMRWYHCEDEALNPVISVRARLARGAPH